MKLNLCLVFALALGLIACGEKKNEDEFPQLPSRISVSSPTDNQQYQKGDTVRIVGEVIDDLGVKALSVGIYQTQYDTLIKTVASSSHTGTRVTFSYKYTYNDTLELDAYVLVKSINQAEEEREKRVPFHVHGKEH